MQITIFLFDDFTALDIVGPYEVLSKIPNSNVSFVGKTKGIFQDRYGLKIQADSSIYDIERCDLLLVPGGPGVDIVLKDKDSLDWIRKIDLTTKWTTSVCSGSILLAASGILKDKTCTTHWRRKAQLSNYDVDVVNIRYIQDEKYVTSAGVSAGIDMALFLVAQELGVETAEIIQLAIEYDPAPPFDSGSPNKASKHLIERAQDLWTSKSE